jgi:hypothetical protein
MKEMKARKSISMVAILMGVLMGSSACGGSFGERAMAAKPSVPLEFGMTLEPSPQNQNEMVLTARATPMIDAPLVRLRVQLPEGIQITQGGKNWAGPLAKGEEKVIRIHLKVSDQTEHRIFGFASIEFPDGTKLSKSAMVTIEAQGTSKQKGHAEPPVKKNRFNENVIELPGEKDHP